ncbi:hypothetical protein FOC4_g10009512 [Fusarium odoratissimum]|uniref:Uncharacterized protein n=1 Tax=Fusarium oxysporum f. sp. cubense (strain race 4) TaxID=2502994 RepID=N1RWP3_FUSC4|nr:hypothetical protein FOC4_g10009512 [Fusarium odoratissimum]
MDFAQTPLVNQSKRFGAKMKSLLGPLLLGASRLATATNGADSLVARAESSLKWEPCKLDLPDAAKELLKAGDCATIEVPLDYTDKKSDKTVELQLIRYNATKEPFKGSVLWNPGGPIFFPFVYGDIS